MKNKIHCISYADKNFSNSKIRLTQEARRFKNFDSFKIFKKNNLPLSFRKEFKTILNKERGAGYWIWKPYIIKKTLESIDEGDYLIYLDAGCSINKKAKKRFFEYLNMLNKSDFGALSFKFKDNWRPEKHWTIKEIFEYFSVQGSPHIINTGQYISTLHIMQKKEHSVFLVDQWIKTLYSKRSLFTDYYQKSNIKNDFFKENRHDQSIFSVIRKIHGSIVLTDESAFLNKTKSMLKNKKNIKNKYPFWASKIRG